MKAKVLGHMAFIALTLLASSAFAQNGKPEKTKVTISIGGITSQVDKLGFAVALHKGFFTAEGVEVEAVDAGSGTRAVQSVAAGAADVAQGSYEHTVRMQPKGVDLVAFSIFARYGGNVLVIPKASAGKIKSVADLKGKKVGISGPGSATQIFMVRILEHAGMTQDDVSYISVGNGPGAVAALRSGQLDALVNLDPNISVMEAAGDIVIMVDGRTAEGMKEIYGGNYLVNSLYSRADWLKANPNTAQALTNAIIHAMRWMSKASVDEIMASMPKEYYESNPDNYRRSVQSNLSSFLWNNIATLDASKRVLDTIAVFEPELKNAKVDLAKTFTNDFTERALKKYP